MRFIDRFNLAEDPREVIKTFRSFFFSILLLHFIIIIITTLPSESQ